MTRRISDLQPIYRVMLPIQIERFDRGLSSGLSCFNNRRRARLFVSRRIECEVHHIFEVLDVVTRYLRKAEGVNVSIYFPNIGGANTDPEQQTRSDAF